MDLDELRQRIDRVDDRILELLNERAQYVQEVGKIKNINRTEMYVPTRERAIFQRLESLNRGPFPTEGVFKVFREIISASLALEHPISVAYLGPRATFTHAAALKQFGQSANLVPQRSIGSVFEEVESGRAQYGVVPIENSNEGAVTHTLDRFMVSRLKVIAECYLPISHDLLSKAGGIDQIERIYSHPQALEQCRRWIRDNCSQAQLIEVTSTARAAQIALEEPRAAAIASSTAATVYGLRALAVRIEDNHHNHTRFLVIGKNGPLPTGQDRTSLLFSFKDQPGILSQMLEPFRKRTLNLLKIESRPVKNKVWEYMFFLDVEGHIQEEPIKTAIEELEKFCRTVKHLGSYPRSR